MSDDPTNGQILQALQQGMWGQQKDLMQGVERRLASKIDAVETKLEQRLDSVAQSVTERMAQEIQDRPVVVHVDMSRVSQLEKQVAELLDRVGRLETSRNPH